ncbi:MAG: thioesterase family protein [Bacteroidales bacterium]|nr:thioesterase family protein [Bacteroidales bacterium]
MPSKPLLTDTDFRVSVPVQVRMSDLDPFVHVNNGNQCHYFDLGRSFYLEKVLQNQVDWKTIDLVLAHIELDFAAPVEFHDQIVCETKIVEIGNKSLKMVQQLRDTKTNTVKTVCRSVLSGFDRQTHQSIPIQEKYKRLIREFEGIGC